MTAPINPTGVTVKGRLKTVFIASGGTDPLTAPSLAIFTGSGAVDMSCLFYTDGFNPTRTTNKSQGPTRYCGTATPNNITTTVRDMDDIKYMVDPQAESTDDGKKAFSTLTPGTTGYFLRRPGTDYTTALAVDDWVEVWYVTLGDRNLDADAATDGSEFGYVQAVQVNAKSDDLVQMVA